MNISIKNRKPSAYPRAERGSTLLVALVFLLIMTVLAVASMRNVSLESRISANIITQKKMQATAESASRDAYRSLLAQERKKGSGILESNTDTCSAESSCLLDYTPSYEQDFTRSMDYSGTLESGYTAGWYAAPVWKIFLASSSANDSSFNPNVDQFYQGVGVFHFEINSYGKETNSGTRMGIRETIALNLKGKIHEGT